MTETKTFYALTSGFSTDHFKSEKPAEVPNDCTVEEREVVLGASRDRRCELPLGWKFASRDGRFELPLGWKWFVSVASRDGRCELPLGWRWFVSVASRDGRFELPLGWKWFVSRC